ncbi:MULTISPECIES: glycerophosphodiester phosphodiesterase family protein [Cytobacillus]|uniref:glycerophosphodiester phosphodiesterase family protein n=1 Tax=Cytobacillus TaxID=2675230 RepID=UPI00203FF772|nr:glycerophosphodiester phosphodiesterase family protein [Cytobacillus firmus]MCM3706967.1 glycerophosphodiester phosphodiesterase [Cytobacillus firmus]
MKKFMKIFKRLIIVLLVLVVFMFLNNTSLFTKERNNDPLLLAHRGMAQSFHMEGITGETCTAERIYEPEHNFLENTIPSMKAAFEAGADVVELDIQLTKDGQFAVFHDWTLDCRTNAKGNTREYTMEELKKLDIGYGYTADHGKTHPFRSKGIGMMPSLDEVMEEFPKGDLLIHIKSNDPEEGVMLAKYLSMFPADRLEKISVYGGDNPIAALKEEMPGMRVMSKATLKECLLPYIGAGWTGYMPNACKNTQVHIPESYTKLLWGWPNKFLNRMDEAGTRVIVVAGDGSWSEGFDRPKDLKRLPDGYSGGIWTNRIELIGPVYKKE